MKESQGMPDARGGLHAAAGPAAALVVLLGGLMGGAVWTGCGPAGRSPAPDAPAAARVGTVAGSASNRGLEGPAEGPPPRFVEIASEAGIHFTRYDDHRGLHRVQELAGGGVACFDYDRDGWVDLFFSNGCRLPLRSMTDEHTSALYQNRGGCRFADVTPAAIGLRPGFFHGCAVGDYNSDGFDDLYVTAYGRNVLWRNNGDGTFSQVAAETLDVPRWSTSAAFADLDRDGMLDLYVVNYLDTQDDPPQLCPRPESPDGYVQCAPASFRAGDDVLLWNDGTGGFVDKTVAAGAAAADGKGLGVVVFDADQDQWPDIFVANDTTPNFFFRNLGPTPARAPREPPFRFREEGMLAGAAVNQFGEPEGSMGIACGDGDGDGWMDLFVTHFYGESNTLYRNLDGSGFRDRTIAARLDHSSRTTVGFGTEFLDYDNDGVLDLVVANGHVDDFTWMDAPEPYRMPTQLYWNRGNAEFVDRTRQAGEYFQRGWVGRGIATADIDNNGQVDIIVSHQHDPVALLHNRVTGDAASVTLELAGRPPSNRSAIGTRIEARVAEARLVREVVGGGSYLSASDRRIHLGLDQHGRVDSLRVVWPSGRVDEWEDLRAGHYLLVEGRAPQRRVAPANGNGHVRVDGQVHGDQGQGAATSVPRGMRRSRS